MISLRRRRVVLGLGASALATSLPLPAQPQGKLRTIGLLFFGNIPTQEEWNRTPLRTMLEKFGWVEGKNLLIERAYAEGKIERLPILAAELVRKRVELIYGHGPDAAIDAARATKTIPIVFWGIAWPVEQGLVDSFAHPGHNVTGVAWNVGTEIYAKQFEFVRRMLPNATRLAWFIPPNSGRSVQSGESAAFSLPEATSVVAKQMGFDVRVYEVFRRTDFDSAFKAMQASPPHGLITPAAPATVLELRRIVDFANRNRIPSFSDIRIFAEAGGLFHYGPDFNNMVERAASYIDRILRGAKPGDLPVELPTKYEMVINRRTAKSLGLIIPEELLLRADEVIE